MAESATHTPLPSLPHPLRHPRAHAQERWRRWWQARLQPRDSLTLTQRNVYILPTRAGWMLALTLGVLLIGSINYQLNLGYLLTFLLAGSAVVGMHLAHGTLRGLSLHVAPPEPRFAGQPAQVQLTLLNTRRSTRYGLGLSLQGSGDWAWTDVSAGASARVTLAMSTTHRGLLPLPVITAETRFPMGTFRVWTLWRPASGVLVYPRPEPNAPALPAGEPLAGGTGARHAPQGTEPDGLRPYHAGDPMQRIAWKASARSDTLISKDHQQQAQPRQLWLDLAQTSGADLEHRLSRLCAWVLQADSLGLSYGLRLPGVSVEPGQDEAHRLRCLEALARC